MQVVIISTTVLINCFKYSLFHTTVTSDQNISASITKTRWSSIGRSTIKSLRSRRRRVGSCLCALHSLPTSHCGVFRFSLLSPILPHLGQADWTLTRPADRAHVTAWLTAVKSTSAASSRCDAAAKQETDGQLRRKLSLRGCHLHNVTQRPAPVQSAWFRHATDRSSRLCHPWQSTTSLLGVVYSWVQKHRHKTGIPVTENWQVFLYPYIFIHMLNFRRSHVVRMLCSAAVFVWTVMTEIRQYSTAGSQNHHNIDNLQ